MEGEPALAWAPSHPMLSSGRASGRLVGPTGRELGFHCSHYLSQVLLLPSHWRERPVCVGSGQAVFSLPAPEPGPGVVPQPGKQLAAAVGEAKECFPTRLSDPEKAKTNISRLRRLHPAHCLGSSPQPGAGNGSLSGPLPSTLIFSDRDRVCGVKIAGDEGFSNLAPLAFGVRSWGLSCAL